MKDWKSIAFQECDPFSINRTTAEQDTEYLSADESAYPVTRDGDAVTTEELATLIEDTKSFDKGIGISTLQRSIITTSAIEEFQRGTAESIVQ